MTRFALQFGQTQTGLTYLERMSAYGICPRGEAFIAIVQIGKRAVIVGQCGISGSTRIGDGAVLAGQVGIAGHLKIGAGAKLAAKSGVMTDIPPGASYGGTPAMPVVDWHRQTIALTRLTKPKRGTNE